MEEKLFLVWEHIWEGDGVDEICTKYLAYVVKTEKEAICLTVGTTKTYEEIIIGKYLLN